MLKDLGGRLVVSHMSTISPIDAQQKLLERCEAAKTIVIPRAEVREATFAYFGRTFRVLDGKYAKEREAFTSKPRCETFEPFDGGAGVE